MSPCDAARPLMLRLWTGVSLWFDSDRCSTTISGAGAAPAHAAAVAATPMAAPAAIAAWAPPLVRRPHICAGIDVCPAVDVHVGGPIHDVGVPARHLGVSAGDIRVLAGHIGGLVDSRPC